MTPAGSVWEATEHLDGNDRLVLVLGDARPEWVDCVYIHHCEERWVGLRFEYEARHLLNSEIWRRIA